MKNKLLLGLLITAAHISAENSTPQKRLPLLASTTHNPFTPEAKLFKAIITNDIKTATDLLNKRVKFVSQFPCDCTAMQLAKSDEMKDLLKKYGLDKPENKPANPATNNSEEFYLSDEYYRELLEELEEEDAV